MRLGHKFGLSPLGVGWVIWRDAEDLPEDLIFRVNYLGGDMPTFALNFSRPGGQIVSQYYNFLRLGREGYRKIHQACYGHIRLYQSGAPTRRWTLWCVHRTPHTTNQLFCSASGFAFPLASPIVPIM